MNLNYSLQPCDHTLKIKMCGTLEYMSPEVIFLH